jgi:nitrite reductase/ring-hydroxylating ferredoxin subunit
MSVNTATGLDVHLYTDPRAFERERETMFRGAWSPVVRADALPPGGYAAVDFFGDPIVVTRNDAGALAAFSNVCLHRACPIAEGNGSARGGVLSCPYHRWTYDLEGRLRGAIHMERAIDFDKRAQRLPPLTVEEWQGWVMVNTDVDAAPIGPQLGALSQVLEPYRVAEMKELCTLEFPSPWNWKVMVDNFMESYHVMAAHPKTLQPIYPAELTYVEPLEGPFVLLENPSVVPSAGALWVACVYPSFLFAVTRGERPIVTWYDMRNFRHDSFHLSIRVMGHPEWFQNPDDAADMAEIVRAIHLEDIRMCEGVWRGLNSRFARPGRLSHLEESTWRFHEYVRSKIGAT